MEREDPEDDMETFNERTTRKKIRHTVQPHSQLFSLCFLRHRFLAYVAC